MRPELRIATRMLLEALQDTCSTDEETRLAGIEYLYSEFCDLTLNALNISLDTVEAMIGDESIIESFESLKGLI